ncbi:MAG: response regulator [Bacteroidales bacterium]|nr:response regulator [Bacteroidales bacterium]
MKKSDLHILMLEDDPFDAELNKEQLLVLEEYNCIFHIVDKKETYLKALKGSAPDIVLCDYNIPGYNGIKALNDLKKVNTLIPLIFVTGTMREEIAADAIKAGAWEYVVKDRLFRLPLAVRSVLKLKEEKEIARDAKERINRLLMAVEKTSTQIIVMDKETKIEYVNKKFTEVTGYELKDVIGKSGYLLGSEDENKEAIIDIGNTIRKGEVYKGELLSRKKDGTHFWELISITPIKNHENEITNYIAVKEDITLRKEMEKELIKARDKAERSDQLKEAFLQNMSHEIRTPLNAIVGFSALLNEKESVSQELIKHYTSIIKNSSNQLLSIVSDVLTMASIQTGQETIAFNPVDLNALFDELYNIYLPLVEEKNIDLIYSKQVSDKKFIITTDGIKLRQILTNLLNNAIKFTQHGTIEFKYTVSNNNIDFLVKDTGIGIAREYHELIFERFRQVEHTIPISYGGTGLGLSISRSFAEMLKGSIKVESKPDHGSSFYLTIPYLAATISKNAKKKANTLLDHLCVTILIAEDEFYNYMLLESILTGRNIKIYHARNGLEATNICKKNPEIDIVIMDIKMPVMDGITAFKEIRKIRKQLPVIAQTAYALEKDKKELLDLGFTDYIAKPIQPEELLEKINMAVLIET